MGAESAHDATRLEGVRMVSKARNKELKKLRGNAQALWQDQQVLLDRASSVLREARRQANLLTQEEFLPRARDAYATRFSPYVTRGTKAYSDTILPAVTSAATAAAALAGTARSALPLIGGTGGAKQPESAAKKATDTTKQAGKVAAAVAAAKAVSKAAPKAAPTAAPKGKAVAKSGGVGAGGIVGIALGGVAALGIGYAVWQTLRADDDLWVADDEPDLPAPGTGPTVEPTS
jgi:hypothetical protein